MHNTHIKHIGALKYHFFNTLIRFLFQEKVDIVQRTFCGTTVVDPRELVEKFIFARIKLKGIVNA